MLNFQEELKKRTHKEIVEFVLYCAKDCAAIVPSFTCKRCIVLLEKWLKGESKTHDMREAGYSALTIANNPATYTIAYATLTATSAVHAVDYALNAVKNAIQTYKNSEIKIREYENMLVKKEVKEFNNMLVRKETKEFNCEVETVKKRFDWLVDKHFHVPMNDYVPDLCRRLKMNDFIVVYGAGKARLVSVSIADSEYFDCYATRFVGVPPTSDVVYYSNVVYQIGYRWFCVEHMSKGDWKARKNPGIVMKSGEGRKYPKVTLPAYAVEFVLDYDNTPYCVKMFTDIGFKNTDIHKYISEKETREEIKNFLKQ